jgi:hypothetical protein
LAFVLAASLAACGGSDAPIVRNDLFAQPANDNTCGIRQTLLAERVLASDRDYTGDIVAMWKRINQDTRDNYPNGIPSTDPIDALAERWITKPIPEVYDQAAVAAANGGPETLPSAILHALKEDGFELVRFYIDEDAVDAAFQLEALRTDEVGLFTTVFPEAVQVNIDVGAEPQTPDALQTLRSELIQGENSYYIVIVNGGAHWIGLTRDQIFNSLADGPIDNSTDFGFMDADPSSQQYNSVTGLILEIQRAP